MNASALPSGAAARMRCVTVEQESLGGSVFQYPRGKLVMTSPATVPLVGKIDLRVTLQQLRRVTMVSLAELVLLTGLHVYLSSKKWRCVDAAVADGARCALETVAAARLDRRRGAA